MTATRFHLNPGAAGTIARMAFFTGARRTGTSVLAQLIHSCAEVELTFEPPLVRGLIPLASHMDEGQWKSILETYLFEDFLVDALAGRRMNLNRADDSCFYKAKGEAEAERRLATGHRHINLFKAAQTRQLAVKQPDMVPYLPRLRAIYPDWKMVVLLRRPDDVIASIMRIGWFSDERLTGVSAEWPHLQDHLPGLPHWLRADETEWFLKATPLERCCHYYERMTSVDVTGLNAAVFCYEHFVTNPNGVFKALAARLGITAGERTETILDGIKAPSHPPLDNLAEITPDWRRRIDQSYDRLEALALRG